MNIYDYLKRIDWESTGLPFPQNDIPSLEGIHLRHVLTFPFENLDVFLTGQVSLVPQRLWNKLVDSRRGGWCFEMNGLLDLVLRELGFKIRPLMARNLMAPGKPRTHEVLLVETQGKVFLADTGFGGTVLRKPFLFQENRVENHHGLDFKLIKRLGEAPGTPWEEPPLWVLQTKKEGQWADLYGFTLEPFETQDFSVANHFHTTGEASSFLQARLVNKALTDGRLSLVDLTLRRYLYTPQGENKISEKIISTPEELQIVLEEKFDLELTLGQAITLYEKKTPPAQFDSGFFLLSQER